MVGVEPRQTDAANVDHAFRRRWSSRFGFDFEHYARPLPKAVLWTDGEKHSAAGGFATDL